MNNQKTQPRRILVPNLTGRGYLHVFRCETVADVDNQSTVEPWALAIASLPPIEHGVLLASRYTLMVLQRLQSDYGRDAFLMTFRSLVADMQHGLQPRSPVGMFIARLKSLDSDGGAFKVEEVV